MKNTSRLIGLLMALVLAVVNSIITNANAQTNGTLVYQDDFSVSNAVWDFALTETQGNQTAINASYGKIEGGYLQLKANVGCGWDYVVSWASLGNIPLPDEFAIEFRVNKLEWCGTFLAYINASNIISEGVALAPWYHISVIDGSRFLPLSRTLNPPNGSVLANPVGANAPNGQWYSHRIEKRQNSLRVYVNNALQYSYDGALFSGGFLQFQASLSGCTFQIYDLKIYDLSPSLTTGLVAYYPFNGNANDESGNSNNATVGGATLSTNRFNQPFNSYFLSGANQYIRTPYSNGFPNSTNDFTISVWICPSQIVAANHYIIFANGNWDQFQLDIDTQAGSVSSSETNAPLDFFTGGHGNAPDCRTISVPWVLNQWYCLLVRRSNNVISVYRDVSVLSKTEGEIRGIIEG